MATTGAPIIVKKIKKGGHGGHHGGAWKVAYADFVTAMMAFFLLMWLLNVTTEEQKSGIADFFTPSTASTEVASGAGGILGGTTVTVPGASVSENSPISISDPMPQDSKSQDETEAEESATPQPSPLAETEPNTKENTKDNTKENTKDNTEQAAQPTEEAIDKAIAERERQQFEQVAQELRQAIAKVPELMQLQKNLIIDETPEGLRIQLVDQEGYSMFQRGSPAPEGKTGELLALVGQAVSKLPNKLSISGHTDSTPYANPNGYGNWELSSDRANAARRALGDAGVAVDRVSTVVGRADRDPFVKDDPADPRNRRLSIILLRQAKTAAAPAAPVVENDISGEATEAP